MHALGLWDCALQGASVAEMCHAAEIRTVTGLHAAALIACRPPALHRQSAANPQGLKTWAFNEGQSFAQDHSSPYIDFMAMQ